MPIYEESRYENSAVAPVAGSDGVYRATVQPALGVPEVVDYSLHRVVQGDRIDLLADQAYGDAEFWWRIAEANPQLEYPDVLKPGDVLRIPTLAVE